MTATTKKKGVMDTLFHRAFKAKDAAELDTIIAEAGTISEDRDININLNSAEGGSSVTMDEAVEARFKTLETTMDAIMKAVTKTEPTTTTQDGAFDVDVQDVAARLEILAPGTKLPTMDASASVEARFKLLRTAKHKALDAAYAEHAELLKPVLVGVDLAKVSDATMDGKFVAASEMVKHKNNSSGSRSQSITKDWGKSVTVDSINTKNAEFWAKQGVRQ